MQFAPIRLVTCTYDSPPRAFARGRVPFSDVEGYTPPVYEKSKEALENEKVTDLRKTGAQQVTCCEWLAAPSIRKRNGKRPCGLQHARLRSQQSRFGGSNVRAWISTGRFWRTRKIGSAGPRRWSTELRDDLAVLAKCYNSGPMKNSRRGFISFGLPAVAALAAVIAIPAWARHSANNSGATTNSGTKLAVPAKAADKGPFYLAYIGTYTTKQESKGIYACNFNPATGEFTPIGLVSRRLDPVVRRRGSS